MKRSLIFLSGILIGFLGAWIFLNLQETHSETKPQTDLDLILVPVKDSVKIGSRLKMALVPTWRSEGQHLFDELGVDSSGGNLSPNILPPFDSYSLFEINTQPLMALASDDSVGLSLSAKATSVFSEQHKVYRTVFIKRNDSLVWWSGGTMIYQVIGPDER